MKQYPPQQPGYPYYQPQQPAKRKFPVWGVGLILIVLLVGGIYAFTSIRSHDSGNLYVGGSYGDFITKYGSPKIGYGGSPGFYADSAQTILLYPRGQNSSVSLAQDSKVYDLQIVAPNTWTIDYTITFCKQFLPGDATYDNQMSVPGEIMFYHSNVGTIDLQLNGPGDCELSIQTHL